MLRFPSLSSFAFEVFIWARCQTTCVEHYLLHFTQGMGKFFSVIEAACSGAVSAFGVSQFPTDNAKLMFCVWGFGSFKISLSNLTRLVYSFMPAYLSWPSAGGPSDRTVTAPPEPEDSAGLAVLGFFQLVPEDWAQLMFLSPLPISMV